jgi:hypothetical protein
MADLGADTHVSRIVLFCVHTTVDQSPEFRACFLLPQVDSEHSMKHQFRVRIWLFYTFFYLYFLGLTGLTYFSYGVSDKNNGPGPLSIATSGGWWRGPCRGTVSFSSTAAWRNAGKSQTWRDFIGF